jgi:LysR family glycine cleavage system transcriptional activator/LysR family transcriptional regulator of beta-lactamase
MSSTLAAVGRTAQQSERLRVLVCRDFASSWLASRVGAFLVENPGVSIEITAEKNGNFRLDEDFDLRIFYGAGGDPDTGLVETELCRWIDLPVCTAEFAKRYLANGRKPNAANYLIDANYDVWDEWCALTGTDAGGPRKHTTIFNETTLCLSVATSGGGLTIGDSFLNLSAITSGDLIVPYPAGLVSAQSYSLFWPFSRQESAAVRKFTAWLQDSVENYQSSVLRALADRGIRVVERPCKADPASGARPSLSRDERNPPSSASDISETS